MAIEVLPGIRRDWRGTNCDSTLDWRDVCTVHNALLTIEARVHFSRQETGRAQDSDETWHAVLPWGSDQAFNDWVSRCKAAVENDINGRGNTGKVWIVPQVDWGVRYTVPGGFYRPNLKCLLRIIPVAANERKHLWLDCYKVDPSYCPRTAAAAGGTIFGSFMNSRNLGNARNYGKIVNVDAWSCFIDSRGYFQDVAAHEFLHFLGLDHVGVGATPACPRFDPAAPQSIDTNHWSCYEPDPATAWSLMGLGNRLEAWMTVPWRFALNRHTIASVDSIGTDRPVRPQHFVARRSVSTTPIHARPPRPRAFDGGVPSR